MEKLKNKHKQLYRLMHKNLCDALEHQFSSPKPNWEDWGFTKDQIDTIVSSNIEPKNVSSAHEWEELISNLATDVMLGNYKIIEEKDRVIESNAKGMEHAAFLHNNIQRYMDQEIETLKSEYRHLYKIKTEHEYINVDIHTLINRIHNIIVGFDSDEAGFAGCTKDACDMRLLKQINILVELNINLFVNNSVLYKKLIYIYDYFENTANLKESLEYMINKYNDKLTELKNYQLKIN